MINFAYVRQGEPLGLGHAVLVARDLVGPEPFAVMLGDDVIDADPPAMKQLIDVFEKVDGPGSGGRASAPRGYLELRHHRPRAEHGSRRRHLSGAGSGREAADRRSAVGPGHHRPLRAHAGHLSRFWRRTKSDRTGEIQLTNGLRELLKTRPIFACEIKGVRHDTGNKLGFLKAVVYFALRRPDLAEKFAAYLATVGIQVQAESVGGPVRPT